MTHGPYYSHLLIIVNSRANKLKRKSIRRKNIFLDLIDFDALIKNHIRTEMVLINRQSTTPSELV